MDRVFVIRAASLYMPVVCALLLWWLRRPGIAERAGILVSCVWNASALLALNVVAQRAHWWHFEAHGALFFGMPVEFFLGWVLLWGVVPVLAFPRERLLVMITIFAAIDFLFMPQLAPVLRLEPGWWVGEGVGLLGSLVPSVLGARWTANRENLFGRAMVQFLTFAALTLWLLPSAIFAARGQHWPRMDAASLFVALQFVCIAGAAGMAAVCEFAFRGGGTPLPYDPPQRLVTTGPYAYVANPMQMAAALVLVAWGVELRSGWVALAGVMAHIYSVGLANWDERGDLSDRFGKPWQDYRHEIHNWLPRWRPYVEQVATLYVSETCGICSQVKGWIERRGVRGLEIRAAERALLPSCESLTCMRMGQWRPASWPSPGQSSTFTWDGRTLGGACGFPSYTRHYRCWLTRAVANRARSFAEVQTSVGPP
jgi:protein-S-isoprenylcysteine O-methyltransferase Ste14